MTTPLQRDLERFRSVPRLEALESLRPERRRAPWTPGRLALAAGAGVGLHLVYAPLATGVAPALLWAIALVGGLVAATYLRRDAGASACAAGGLLSLVGAAWALQASPGVTGGVLALGLVAAGLVQRLTAPPAC